MFYETIYSDIINKEADDMVHNTNLGKISQDDNFIIALHRIRIFSCGDLLERKILKLTEQKKLELGDITKETNMKRSDYIYKILDKMVNLVINMDMSADEKAELIGLKYDVYQNALKLESKVEELLKQKTQWVIKLLEDGKLVGYVDYYKTNDKECPTVPAIVKDINEVENDVYDTLEEALEQINILQATANTFAEFNPDDPELVYEPEQRN